MNNTILIAEDDRCALRILTNFFRKMGFTVHPVSGCSDAIRLAEQVKPDCFLLDYHLADETAADICRFVRGSEQLKQAPVIILSGDPEQAINSYDECQADVFVEKGRSYREILALINRQLRRAGAAGGNISANDLVIDAATLCLLRDGKMVATLSPEQFRFLSLLFKKSPAFLTEREIFGHVFMVPPVDKRDAIASLVYRLRQKIGPQLARRIKSHRLRGWIYVPPRVRSKTSIIAS